MVLGSFHSSSLFCAGVVASAHGIRGHVKIKCFLEDPTKFKAYSPFSNERGEEVYKVNKVLSENKDVLIIALEGVEDRNEAERLRGEKLMCSREKLPELTDDQFYHTDLIGLPLVTLDGQSMGTVHALYNFGAGDILEIKTLQGKLKMIPFNTDIVPEVKIKEGFLSLSEQGKMLLNGESDDS